MKKIIYMCISLTSFSIIGCSDLLERPELTRIIDDEGNFWRNEQDFRLYANDFYPNYFVGYNSAWGVAYAPLTGYNFSDDLTSQGTQAGLLASLPTSGGGASTVTPAVFRIEYPGPVWNFYWVRKANVMIERLEEFGHENLSEEEYAHWSAVSRFFRGYEYSRLVSNFGDVPYYDSPVPADDFDIMYKDRENRGFVMDQVYEDFQYALENMRVDDGSNYVNRYAAAALISNLMLFEGSWHHYHNMDAARAKKYLEFARDAAEIVMDAGQWSFTADFKSLFASDNLAGHPEVIFHREYDDGLTIRHSVGSYSNGTEGQARSVNLNLLQSFICIDGQAWQSSDIDDASNFRLQSLAVTRDSRLEATLMDTINTPATGTMVYTHKFAAREALSYIGGTYPPKWGSNTNTNDAPVVRLAEVVLNWIEAKQILAEHHGGAAVTQADLDRSINAIRERPLDDVATAKGVQQTAPLLLGNIPNDPSRDADVSALMWEIRRERRMEFIFEYARIQDIRRWKKLHYLDFEDDSYRLGSWIIGTVDFGDRQNPGKIIPTFVNVLQVMKPDGSIVTYNGSNDSEMTGYYVVRNFARRLPVEDRNYLAPVSLPLIQTYADRGYTLTQTPGWE